MRPDPKGLTRAEAKRLSDRLDELAATYTNTATSPPSGGPVGIPIRGARFRNGMPAIIAYAETLSDVVARTVAPVRIAGLAAAGLLLATAGAMLARARATELRLRVLRGVSPVAVGARVGFGAAPAVAIGVAGGFVLALLGVMALGPTPELEPDPLRAALLACLGGALAGIVVVGGVATAFSARSVDSRPRHHWLRWIPWELVVVGLAIVSYARLDKAGGVRLVGSQAQGGDLLAQAFPLLALGAVLVVLARPLRWLLAARRSRGSGLPVPLLIGVRRLSSDAGVTVLATLAVGLVIGSVALSSMLTDSASALLREKAGTFLGSDLVVSVNRAEALPPSLASKATVVLRASTHDHGTRVDMLGVDPETFIRTNGANPSDRAVAKLLEAIAPTAGRLGPRECDRRARHDPDRDARPTRRSARRASAPSRPPNGFPATATERRWSSSIAGALDASDLGARDRGVDPRSAARRRRDPPAAAVSWCAVRPPRATSSRSPASSRCGGRTRCSPRSAS